MDSDKVFRLKHLRQELKICFYLNGLIIENYKFYPYNSLEGKNILKDLLDGYTPYILKDDYPNGVILKQENNLLSEYKPNNTNTKGINDTNINKKLSAVEFLNKLPEKVVKDGKVFNIREEIEKHLVVKRNNDEYYENDEIYLFDKSSINEENICKLKIQILMIDKVITINILKDEKISELFNFLKKTINSKIDIQFSKIKDIQTYILYSTYPFKIYSYDENKTIFELGLFPSYFLIFEQKSKINK